MNVCVYPNCKEQTSGLEEDRAEWCKEHRSATCHAPHCEEFPIPAADTCQVHFAFVELFQWMHIYSHQQALREAMAQQQYQQTLRALGGNGKDMPGGLIRGR